MMNNTVSMILDEYKRVYSLPTNNWRTMDDVKRQRNRFTRSLVAMRDAGQLSDAEFEAVKSGIEDIKAQWKKEYIVNSTKALNKAMARR